MKKKILSMLVVFCALFVLVPATAMAAGDQTVVAKDQDDNQYYSQEPVATVNGKEYDDLQEAIKAAAPAGTVELLSNVTVDKWVMISETLSIGGGQLMTLDMNGLNIDGNGHTLTINDVESAGNGNHLFYDGDYNITDLTIKMGDNANGLGITSGTIKNVTFIGGRGISGGAAIHVADGLVTGVHAGNVTIEGCTFKNNGGAIYSETAQNGLVVDNNTFEIATDANVILMRGNEKFTNNTIVSGRTVNVVSGSPVVTGNDFGNVRFKVYNEATATISGNTINTLAFDDDSDVIKSTFIANTLSTEAKAVLEANNVVDATPVAKIGETPYATLAEAVAAANGDTVTLLDDVTGAGVVIDNDVTIDFGGFTYTVNQCVGSAGTETLGFQILKDNTVTLKNGTLAAAETVVSGNPVKMLVQNYADLTLTDMTLDGTGSSAMQYVLSNNSGEIEANGDTSITAGDSAVAFDVYDYSSAGYAVPSMTINTTGIITGEFEVSETASLTIEGGTFTVEPDEAYIAEGYRVDEVGDMFEIVKDEYTVTFEVDGSTVDSKTIANGSVVSAPADPTKTGYTFAGWYFGETAYDFTAAVTGHITLTAKWEPIPVTGISLDKTTLSLKAGETDTLTATVAPADAADKTVTWTTSNESVATVDANGVVTAKSAGTATITATAGEFSATCTVTVTRVVSSSTDTSSGSSSSSNITTSTEKNSDGSTTTTTTNKSTGTVTETTKTTDGVTGTTVTDKDGEITSVSASVPTAAANAAEKGDEPVTLPVEVPVATNTDDAPAIKVDIPASVDEVKVEIPVENVSAGTVAVIVHADGTEEIVRTSTITEDGVVLTVGGDVTVKIVDNSKDFTDVADDYALSDSIDFVSARGLFEGNTETTFDPHANTTVAQTMTVLARLSGEDFYGAGSTQKGAEWAVEKGLDDGSDIHAAITREQMVVMMWKLAGSPDSEQVLNAADLHEISDHALAAMRWAVEMGILKGNLDGTLNPTGHASRAHVAAFSERYVNAI